jgi:L-lactate dehydrogenase complex protein LldG
MTEKHGRKPDKTPKTDDEKLDQALDQSFPASDPPAQTEPTVNVRSKKKPIHKKA